MILDAHGRDGCVASAGSGVLRWGQSVVFYAATGVLLLWEPPPNQDSGRAGIKFLKLYTCTIVLGEKDDDFGEAKWEHSILHSLGSCSGNPMKIGFWAGRYIEG